MLRDRASRKLFRETLLHDSFRTKVDDLRSSTEASTLEHTSAVANGVRTILAEALKRQAADIPLDADLESGLGIDSMTMIDVSVSLEERFDIALPQFAAPREIAVRTVGDLIAFIEQKVGEVTARSEG